MKIKNIFRPIKHCFHSPGCQSCSRPLDNVHFAIEEGKLICPFCEAKNDPAELYNDSEIIDFSELLIPNEYETFLTNAGFSKKPIRRTPKIGLIFIIGLMALGALIGVLSSDTNMYLKIIFTPFVLWLTVSQILSFYKEEEKPKWYRKKITTA